jgi:PD-(D/E)XK nuclease superfamily protein
MNNTDAFWECMAAYTALCNSRGQVYADVLARAAPIMEKQRERYRLRPPNFNIFQALGHAYREVSTHSAMLAHLLDPAGSHAQSALFLHNFLDVVQTAASRQGKSLPLPQLEDPTQWRCRREVPLSDSLGQVDVLLRGPGLLLIIENKVYADDPVNQLKRYWEFAQTEAEARRALPVIVYLTPDGRAPPPHSVGQSPRLTDNLILLSYAQDIHQFIQRSVNCLAAVSVAEVLRQYAELVRGIK